MRALTNHERTTIWNALAVAAERFDEDATRFAEVAAAAQKKIEATGDGHHALEAATRLSAQFAQQALDSRALMELFE